MIKNVAYKEFLNLIKEIPIVIGLFWTSSSNPSLQMIQLMESELDLELKKENKIALVKINADKNKNFIQGLEINSVPCIMIFFQGNLLEFNLEDKEKILTDLPSGEKKDRLYGYYPEISRLILTILQFLKQQLD